MERRETCLLCPKVALAFEYCKHHFMEELVGHVGGDYDYAKIIDRFIHIRCERCEDLISPIFMDYYEQFDSILCQSCFQKWTRQYGTK